MQCVSYAAPKQPKHFSISIVSNIRVLRGSFCYIRFMTCSIKVRDDELWQDVYNLVQKIYSKIDDLIASFPNEEWTTASKLRNSANDGLFYISQAVGSIAPETSKYDLNNARKNLFALQSMYTFATKQKFIELEPELIVGIDKILTEIDKRIAKSDEETKIKNKEELEPWLEKYRLWQKMQD